MAYQMGTEHRTLYLSGASATEGVYTKAFGFGHADHLTHRCSPYEGQALDYRTRVGGQ